MLTVEQDTFGPNSNVSQQLIDRLQNGIMLQARWDRRYKDSFGNWVVPCYPVDQLPERKQLFSTDFEHPVDQLPEEKQLSPTDLKRLELAQQKRQRRMQKNKLM